MFESLGGPGTGPLEEDSDEGDVYSETSHKAEKLHPSVDIDAVEAATLELDTDKIMSGQGSVLSEESSDNDDDEEEEEDDEEYDDSESDSSTDSVKLQDRKMKRLQKADGKPLSIVFIM